MELLHHACPTVDSLTAGVVKGRVVVTSQALEECRMKPRLAGAFLLTAVLALCGTAFAHHGNVAYEDKPIDIKHGTVTKFIWTNPHSFIMFDATDDKGEVEHWAVE